MAFSDLEEDVARRVRRVRRRLRRRGLRLSRRPASERALAGDGYHVILYDSIVFGFDTNPWAASLSEVEVYARDARVEVWDHRHSFPEIDSQGIMSMNSPSTFPSVTNILARNLSCRCIECLIESQLAEEFGPELSEAASEVEARRLALRVAATKGRKITGELTAYQIASLNTDEERLGAVRARLDQLREGRKTRPIDCNAIWALRDDYAPLHQGFVPLPTRAEHDAMIVKFVRPKRKAA